MRERFQKLGRFLPGNWPWKSKETPPYETYEKTLLDQHLAQADKFIDQHKELLDNVFFGAELAIFRLAFASVTLPSKPYPFSQNPKDSWQTPDEQLNIMANRVTTSYKLDPDDVFTNDYLKAIISCGKEAAILNSERPEDFEAYLKNFQDGFTFIKRSLIIL